MVTRLPGWLRGGNPVPQTPASPTSQSARRQVRPLPALHGEAEPGPVGTRLGYEGKRMGQRLVPTPQRVVGEPPEPPKPRLVSTLSRELAPRGHRADTCSVPTWLASLRPAHHPGHRWGRGTQWSKIHIFFPGKKCSSGF